jgi:hypothetical protein
MTVEAGNEAVADDEIVFRRISDASGWYDPASDRPLAWLAFRPSRRDVDGISVWTSKFKTAREVAAIGASHGKRYFVVSLRVQRLRVAGVVVKASPELGGVGHASLTNLSTEDYTKNKDRVREMAEVIVRQLVENIDGPFGS